MHRLLNYELSILSCAAYGACTLCDLDIAHAHVQLHPQALFSQMTALQMCRHARPN